MALYMDAFESWSLAAAVCLNTLNISQGSYCPGCHTKF